ncbi:MAG: hypothetical protein ACFCUQ_09680 [Kiloniellales bacterium]
MVLAGSVPHRRGSGVLCGDIDLVFAQDADSAAASPRLVSWPESAEPVSSLTLRQAQGEVLMLSLSKHEGSDTMLLFVDAQA